MEVAESMQSRLLVAGAINTDLVGRMKRAPHAGETITGTGFAVFGGGKGANQAVAAARCGSQVGFIGAVGNDQFGVERLRDLRNDGIDVSGVAEIDGVASGVALIFVEETGENRIAYIPGATSRIDRADVLAAYRSFRPSVLLAPNELPTDALMELFSTARRDGVTTILNATPDSAQVKDLLKYVSILVVNEHEAVEILGDQVASHADAARRLGVLLNGIVAVTAGEDGAYLWTGSDPLHVRGPHRNAIDTTGAGDTFCGVFAGELARGVSLATAVTFGVHASGISVTRSGAQASIPRRDEVQRSITADRPA